MDAELLERLEDLVDLGLARAALAVYEAKGGVDWEDLKEALEADPEATAAPDR